MDSTPTPISVSAEELAGDDRFHRFGLIPWWDQKKLANARVLVVGAGALGNEIIKNLALLGVGNVLIADLDVIENSNLSRSVLYRTEDNGQPKALVAARAARSIYPAMRTHSFHGNIVYDLGLGVYRWADIVLGGLDNREARLSINRNCFKLNKSWVDGAIEQIQGTARFFSPGGPCYECTMSQTDWKLLQSRRSCNLLSRSEMQAGKTPTTPTISSIIAGVQTQEAIKHLHGLTTLAGKGWVYDGISGDSYTVDFQRKEDCYSHDLLENITSLDSRSDNLTARQLLDIARKELGPSAELELPREVLRGLTCPKCRQTQELFLSLGHADTSLSRCPVCAQSTRDVLTFHRIRGDEAFLDRTLAEIGIPAFDIITASVENRRIGYELSGDASAVLGPLDHGGDLQWI